MVLYLSSWLPRRRGTNGHHPLGHANPQCAFRAPCCHRWFDCSECHFESSDHELQAAPELALLCKQCRKPFRKDLTHFGAEDERCPHCGNAIVRAADVAAISDMPTTGARAHVTWSGGKRADANRTVS